jgi:imidazolonepropionase-like amidohydrolase
MLRRLLLGGLLTVTACSRPPTLPTQPAGLTAAHTPAATGTARVTAVPTASLQPLTATPAPTTAPTAPPDVLEPFLAFEVAEGEVIALTGATVIDGTGAPAQANWTVLIQDERILNVGADVPIPDSARVMDLAGQTVIPGLFDLHAHLYSSDGRSLAGNFVAYPRLHLAGGVTTIYSPGDFAPQGAFNLRELVERGEAVGPHILTAGPYFDGPGGAGWMKTASTAAELRAAYGGWHSRIDGVKVYTHITEEQLAALVEAAHAEGLPVTAHLASVTAGRAIELGIDGLEHGLFSMSEFFTPSASFPAQYCALAEVDMASPEVAALVDAIIAKGVYVDPTMVVFLPELADFEPIPPDWDRYVTPLAVPHVLRFQRSIQLSNDTCLRQALANQQALIRMIHGRGGLVVPGTDAVIPIVLPGYGLHRELQLFVEAGLTPLEAIRSGTLDAATALGLEDDRGSLTPGKRADLIVLAGDPSVDINALGSTQLVFKDGRPYDPTALRASVEGLIGIP